MVPGRRFQLQRQEQPYSQVPLCIEEGYHTETYPRVRLLARDHQEGSLGEPQKVRSDDPGVYKLTRGLTFGQIPGAHQQA